jgi:prepilin-type N-terminal cleavage/methylation domain-containing protein/prepilin-type processing-associated H-X9-DG protein
MKPTPTRGFSLVELLIVVIIIAMLVAMLYPTLQRAYDVARHMQCSDHLYRISQAYHMRGADERMEPARFKALSVYRWRSSLVPYLSGCSYILSCPQGDAEPQEQAPIGGAGDTGGDTGGTDTGGGTGGTGGSGGGGGGGSSGVSTENLKVEVWLRPGEPFRGVNQNELIYVMDCEPGYWAMKKNESGNSYELWFEDSWNVTWNDVKMKFEKLSDGSLQITYLEENTGGNCYNLIDIATGEALLRGMGDGNAAHGWPKLPYGAQVTISPEEQADSDAAFGTAGGSFGTDTSGGGGGEAASGSGPAGNYGMNSLQHNQPCEGLGTHTILCMDYKKSIARGPTVVLPEVPDDWMRPGWEAVDGKPVFARHGGMVNVLFADGSVDLVDPAVLDPRNGTPVAKYWALHRNP